MVVREMCGECTLHEGMVVVVLRVESNEQMPLQVSQGVCVKRLLLISPACWLLTVLTGSYRVVDETIIVGEYIVTDTGPFNDCRLMLLDRLRHHGRISGVRPPVIPLVPTHLRRES